MNSTSSESLRLVEEPQPLQPSPTNRQQRTGSFSSLRSSLNRFQTSQLAVSRVPTSYSVHEIYGDMDSDEIENQRLENQNEVLRTLSRRVLRMASREQVHFHAADLESQKEQLEKDDGSNYEDLPDTAVPTKDFGGEFTAMDPELVAWDGPDDPEYPRNWSMMRKFYVTGMVSLYSLISPMSSSVLSPAMPAISESINLNNSVVQSLCVSIMVLAWA